jgi:hypothetical protein
MFTRLLSILLHLASPLLQPRAPVVVAGEEEAPLDQVERLVERDVSLKVLLEFVRPLW